MGGQGPVWVGQRVQGSRVPICPLPHPTELMKIYEKDKTALASAKARLKIVGSIALARLTAKRGYQDL